MLHTNCAIGLRRKTGGLGKCGRCSCPGGRPDVRGRGQAGARSLVRADDRFRRGALTPRPEQTLTSGRIEIPRRPRCHNRIRQGPRGRPSGRGAAARPRSPSPVVVVPDERPAAWPLSGREAAPPVQRRRRAFRIAEHGHHPPTELVQVALPADLNEVVLRAHELGAISATRAPEAGVPAGRASECSMRSPNC